MKTCSFLLALLLQSARFTALAQLVGIGTPTPSASAALDIVSSGKGLLISRFTAAQRTVELPARSAPDPAAPVQTGFSAQQVEAAAKSLGFAFDGLHASASAHDYYGLGYAEFVGPLVRAVQQQQAQLEQLRAQNAALRASHSAKYAAYHAATAATAALLLWV